MVNEETYTYLRGLKGESNGEELGAIIDADKMPYWTGKIKGKDDKMPVWIWNVVDYVCPGKREVKEYPWLIVVTQDGKETFFDKFGNHGNDYYHDNLTNNRIAVDMMKWTFSETQSRATIFMQYIGKDGIDVVKDYLFVAPTFFQYLPLDLIRKHGEELLDKSIDSLKMHYKGYASKTLERKNGFYFDTNLHGMPLANSFMKGIGEVYIKYLKANGKTSDEARDIVKNKMKSLNGDKAKVDKFIEYSKEIKDMAKIKDAAQKVE